jgi:Major intrinsic protein
MSELPRQVCAEFLGTALLLAAVVGSGIMGQELAGGNAALALLGNTLPTGAILTVLVLVFGPISGAHSNPAVSLALALTAASAMGSRACLSCCSIRWSDRRRNRGSHDVRLAAVSNFQNNSNWFGTMACRSNCDVRPGTDNLRMRRQCPDSDCIRRRTLHHRRLLVHGIDFFRQSRCDLGKVPVQYLRGNCAERCIRFHSRPNQRGVGGGDASPLVLADVGSA